MKKNSISRQLVALAFLGCGGLALAAKAAAPDVVSGKADLGASAVAAAQEPLTIKKTETSHFDFWSMQCDQYSDVKIGKRCAARLPVFKSNTTQLLAVLVLAQDDAKAWNLKVIIPTSISVIDGATIAFDGSGAAAKPQILPIETCEPAACASSLPLDPALNKTLNASNKVTVGWIGIGKNPIKIDFEIKGIQQTMKALFG